MSFEAIPEGDGWQACDGPLPLASYGAQDGEHSGAVLDVRTYGASPPPLSSQVSVEQKTRVPRALDSLRHANTLLRGGRSDEEVERLTGVEPGEILSLRAMLATAERPAVKRDRFGGRRWWK